jgi:hypothetical protein
MTELRKKPMQLLVAAAIVAGVAAGSFGIASAASGNGSTSTSSSATASAPSGLAAYAATPPSPGQGWGAQRSDETLLTGDTATKVEAAAKAKVPDGTIVRVETDADGHALYEAHMTKADGTLVTVYVDEDFNVVDVETR